MPSPTRSDSFKHIPHSLLYQESQASSQPLSRRSSVFSDFLTLFRKSTTSRRRSVYRPPPRRKSTAATLEQGVSLLTRDELAQNDDEENDDEANKKPMTRQLLLSKIREKKEVINNLRCKPWSMNRKRRTLRLAQKYLEQHESKVSPTHLYKEELSKKWHYVVRWFSNINTYLVPWESKIKRIESHFGSVVSSYFTFLRWVIFMNLIITLLICAFIVLPETIADATANSARQDRTMTRKVLPYNERKDADTIQVIWHYDGYIRYSPLFYGYYSDDEYDAASGIRYSLPLAYFATILLVFGYSFFAILRKMASNASMSKLTGSKAEQYVFNWKLFTGWDYTIGNSETATNTVMAVVIKLRESIAESRVQNKEKFQCLRFSLRVMANMIILAMLAFSIYWISFAVQSSHTVETSSNLIFNKNQVPTVVSLITHFFPMIFDLIGRMEAYHPRTALRAHLARVLVLYVLNYITFIVALFEKLDKIRDSKNNYVEGAEGDRNRRQLHVNFNGKSFQSRNFSDFEQLKSFFGKGTFTYTGKRRRTTTTPRPTAVTVDGMNVEVANQYGPVGVNRATALLRNKSLVTPIPRFETRPLGPTRINEVKSRILPPRLRLPSHRNREQEYGPHWEKKFEESSEEQVSTVPVFSLEQPDPGSQEKIIAQSDGPREVYNNQICWETMIGQQIVRLVMMDMYITIASILIIDFLRGIWIRYTASWWCWDVENVFPEYGEFKVAENVLHLINNQGMVWLGLFFAPLLPAINNVKLIIFMYIRAWAVITCNVPAREIFRASRSSNFYLIILLLWLLLCTLPVGYVIASKQPSSGCGPFAGRTRFYDVITQLLEDKVDKKVLKWLRYIASPGVVIPILLLLILMIYFLVSLVRGLREANTDLQQQLVHERTEEKKKIFELAGGQKKRTAFPFKPQQRKTATQHIPEVEAKRREPWRAHNGRDNVASLCPTDEPPSSPNSPTSQPPSPPSFRKRSARADEYLDERAFQMPKTMSLTSLNEESDETKSAPMTKSFSAARGHEIDWSEGGKEKEKKEVRTPEEIRRLMAPLMASVTGSALSLAQFPSEEQVTVIFGNKTSLGGTKLRDSFVSLYDNEKGPEGKVDRTSRTSLSKALRSVDNVCLPFSMPQTSIGPLKNGESVQEHSQSISLYSREPRRLGQSPLVSSASAPPRRFSYDRRDSLQALPPQRVEIKPRQDEFVPWPSIEEVRAQRAHLLPKNRDRPRPDSLRERSNSIQRAEIDEPGPSEAQPRRFRISVSPTRKIQESEIESLPPAPSRPKFIIKQRLIPGSTLSMASTFSKTSSQPSTPSKPSTPVAPRVGFGDDDSPRIEQ
ncbi:unnamed protein product [Bursaphelenchus okinawaensis]|uniref:TMC domain-containing protein n=1 Tax=Bursaphelenchus okinawaensis TaxID=465554 RepID=A0A811LH65_9BILA|nr:unnamed protein product [Bursaphelenchus okinawaensis]CAG9125204.1 unnamed protein product [Bursaphelenchus okinawaensis]